MTILIPLISWTCSRDRSSEQAWPPGAKNSVFSEDGLSSAHLVVGFGVLVDVSGNHLAQGRAVAAAEKKGSEKKGSELGERKLLFHIPPQDLSICFVQISSLQNLQGTKEYFEMPDWEILIK